MNNFKTSGTVNSILNICDNYGISVRPMKLQKLLYFCCGYHYAKNDD